MARKSNELGDAFSKFSKEKKEQKSKEETPSPLNENKGNLTVEDVKKNLQKQFEAKTNKKTVEETHTRSTFLFRNDLSDRLSDLAQERDRGFKTMFINMAIEALLDEWEK